MHPTVGEKRCFDEISDNQEEAGLGSAGSLSEGGGPASPRASMEQEKRIRREIANSNERRRMQSINAGFQTLRALLPQREGEKLSKAAILQQTSDFIYSLEQEKTRLLTQNCQLKRLLGRQQGSDSEAGADSPRRSLSQEDEPAPRPASTSSGEPLAAAAAAPAQAAALEPLRRELLELRAQLERESVQRLALEERLRAAEQPPKQEFVLPEYVVKPEYEPVPAPPPQPQPQHQQQQQPQPHSHQVHMRFKTSRHESVSPTAEEPPAQTVLLPMVPEQMMPPVEDTPPPPPPPPALPPVVSHRPLYVSSATSRQNLDTIVEAIRHLEGDHLFSDAPEPAAGLRQRLELPEPQEAPLELTTHARTASDAFRPGVIVVQPHQHPHLHPELHQHPEVPRHRPAHRPDRHPSLS